MLLFLFLRLLILGLFLDYGSLRQWLPLRPSPHFNIWAFVPGRQFDPSLKLILSSHLVILFVWIKIIFLIIWFALFGSCSSRALRLLNLRLSLSRLLLFFFLILILSFTDNTNLLLLPWPHQRQIAIGTCGFEHCPTLQQKCTHPWGCVVLLFSSLFWGQNHIF